MAQNKYLPIISTVNGVALKNASKSLKITNKLLAEVDDFDKHWEWWLSLEDYYRALFLKNVLDLNIANFTGAMGRRWRSCRKGFRKSIILRNYKRI